ncbi:olfactory receptor 6B1-like [Rana temporaria]|uniref:olfactory receptor 6B1-like n=1 Tax=Rana temporaria TaxID=8407 RepID=UPI001AACB9B5|nr:olfactory receptor 6B1-like [Rana temporaria]
MSNQSSISKFLLAGFSACQDCQIPIFSVFLLIYIITILENMSIVLLVIQDRKLWKPMYISIGNLSFLETGYVNVTLPNMLFNIITGNNEISFSGCLAQLFFFVFLCAAECYLLATMAYDRYIAICMPLQYPVIMQEWYIWCLLLSSWSAGFCTPVYPIYLFYQMNFCGSNKIDHYFCDASPLLKLACGNIKTEELVDFFIAAFVLLSSLLVISISYICIAQTILKMPSSNGRQKAFSTCTSHLTVVCIFYGSLCFTYMRVTPDSISASDKLVSVLYLVITPLFNPIIYTLRNRDVKLSLQNVLANHSKTLNKQFH